MATAGKGRGAAPPGAPQLPAGSSCNPRGPAAVRGGSSGLARLRSSSSSSASQPGCLPREAAASHLLLPGRDGGRTGSAADDFC